MKAVLTALLFCALSLPATAAPSVFWRGGSHLFGVSREPVPPGVNLQLLIRLTSDRDSDVTYLSAMRKKDDTLGGFYGSHAQPLFSQDDDATGRNVFWLEEVESPSGAVLAESQGHKAIILNGQLDRSSQEGRFVVRYLSNGLFNRYKSCEFLLRRNGNGWFIQNAYTGRPITDVKVITHALGISTLQGLCPAS
jgi:hypothetical protein